MIRTAALINSLGTSCRGAEPDVPAEGDRQGEEIVIDFREPSPSEGKSERAFELDRRGWLRIDIAHEIGCSKSRLTKLLKDTYARHDIEMADGRTRRSSLAKKHQSQPPYQRLSDEVFALLEEGWLMEEIAQRLGRDRNTVTKAMKFAYQSRGLPVPDGRTRRKSLDRKVSCPRRRRGENQGDDGAAQ
jgi:hypothetical protein